MCDQFCNLHSHTAYSLLDGYGLPHKMIERAADLNQRAIAITDHGNMSGLIEAKIACEKYGVKLIPGSELYMAPFGEDVSWRPDDGKRKGTSFHLTVWAYNQTGYQNLLRLTELANKMGHYYVPRVDQYMISQYNEGLVITSGCISSYVGSQFTRQSKDPRTGARDLVFYHDNKSYRNTNEFFDWAMDIFGRDRFYIEIQDHNMDAIRKTNDALSIINERYGFGYIATNDTHYPTPDDANGQATSMCVGQRVTLKDPGQFVGSFIDHPDYYMTDYDEMKAKDYGFDVPDSAFTNTLVVADMLEPIYFGYEPGVKKYRFPVMSEYEDDYDSHLRSLVKSGYYHRYKGADQDGVAARRAQYELQIIDNLGFASYFLCIYDIMKYCSDNAIPATVRGSAGGSIILYCIGVTDFCPIEYDLIFERFLNPERVSAPDVDLDIDPDRRGEVISYIVDKYGDDKVAQVLTFSLFKGKSSIKDAARILEYPVSFADSLIDKLNNDDESLTKFEAEILKVAGRLQGQIRHRGVHAGAVVVSDRSLSKDYPLSKPPSEKKDTAIDEKVFTDLTIALKYKTVENMGGIKIDVLGVSALSIIYNAIEIINEKHGTSYRFENIPVDDPASYDLVNSGILCEIFQLSGYAARPIVQVIQPKTISDIMVCNSICRPGPAKYAQVYADRMHGVTQVTYKHRDLIDPLKDTYGIMLYQENIMRVSQIMAGFSLGQADILRKAVSDKKSSGFATMRTAFTKGAMKNGYTKKLIDEVWEDIVEFAGYGFNASHSASYARIAMKQAYLKVRYPLEYYAAALTGRQNNRDAMIEIMTEAKANGVTINPPMLGRSDVNRFTIDYENNALRFPYSAVKHIGKAGISLSKIRSADIEDLKPVDLKLFKKIGKRALESAAMVGILEPLFDDRNKALDAIPYLSKGLPPITQMSFIEAKGNNFSDHDFLTFEKELTGLYLSGHPLDKYPIDNTVFQSQKDYERNIGDLEKFIGIISKVNVIRDRNNNIMAFIDLEDREYKKVSIVIFSGEYKRFSELLVDGNVCKVLGEISENNNKKYGLVSIIAKQILGE